MREARARAGNGGLNGTPGRKHRPSLETPPASVSVGGRSSGTSVRAATRPTATPSTISASSDAPREAPPVYDLSYRDAFWPVREYEDQCDRLALRALMPRTGGRLLDVGAGFGRLADEYAAFERVTLIDASPAMLAAARERIGTDPRFSIVGGEASRLPFADETFDVVVSVRLLVNVRDPLSVFRQVARVLRPGGTFIVEFPNRVHVLAALRFALGRQSWSPTSFAPHEYRPQHFAHHPTRIRRQLVQAGLEPDAIRAVSLFRASWLKGRVPTRLLTGVESVLQGPLGPLTPGPSVFVRAVKPIGTTIASTPD